MLVIYINHEHHHSLGLDGERANCLVLFSGIGSAKVPIDAALSAEMARGKLVCLQACVN